MRASLTRLVQILPRSRIAKETLIPSANTSSPTSKLSAAQPSLIRELGAREAVGRAEGSWPENLRIEMFGDEKGDWTGYTGVVRAGLRKFAREH